MSRETVVQLIGCFIGAVGALIILNIDPYICLGVFLMIWGNNICENKDENT